MPTPRGTRPRARSSAGTSVSGTKRPPNSPKRPRPTGSGPGGSRCTGVAADGRGHRVLHRTGSSTGAVDAIRDRISARCRAVSARELVDLPVERAVDARGLRALVVGERVAGLVRGLDEPAQLARRPCGRATPRPRSPTSTPHGRTRWIASPTLSGVRPPASISRTPPGAPSASSQSNTVPEPGLGRVDEHDVGRAVRRRGERGVAGGERLDHERHPLADPAHLGERLAPVELRAA